MELEVPVPDASDSTLVLLKALSKYLQQASRCTSQQLFGYANGTIAGVYAGASLGSRSVVSLLDRLREAVNAEGTSSSLVSQVCSNDSNSNDVIGVAVDTNGDLAAVQKAVMSWDQAECFDSPSEVTTEQLHDVAVWETPNARITPVKRNNRLQARAECSTVSVVAGDGCGKLAERCGISPSDFTKFNPKENLCSSLKAGQRVCCSAGDLPDIKPKPNEDGSCATYVTLPNDTCDKIALQHGLEDGDLSDFNDGTTWGWNGCDPELFFHSTRICVSKGDPPLPAPVANAVCGPLKPGSTRPTDGTMIEDMNPCPLKACCNIWGQCGISGDFCTEGRGPTDNPGTAPKDVNGCVSSCGTEIIKGFPKGRGRVGYYGSWNFNRKCLHLRSSNANTDGSYTIIHWSFAEINTADWTVNIVDKYKQYDGFKALTKVKKVISFGGWDYSTLPATYDIFRQAVSPANRERFATNVADFLKKEGLDGVDFDWEYPGAPDIDGAPSQPTDAPNYYKFLSLMKTKLSGTGRTLSIAAPASFWYLKQFPIAEMAKELHYIVYMTYDLHVTKAGVDAEKIYVGESSYGRSFKMAQAGCVGPNCKCLGSRETSLAAKGECTDTAGYIANAEIEQIINAGGGTQYRDAKSDSDILSFTDDEWLGPEGTAPEEPAPPERAECKGTYDQLSSIPSDTPRHCKNLYILQSLRKMLKDTLQTYDNLINGGYDKKFNTYADAVVQGGNKQVENFMFTKGNDYFKCKLWAETTCCSFCYGNPGQDPERTCRYCENYDCNWDTVCNNPESTCWEPERRYKEIDINCPPDYSERTHSDPWVPNQLYSSDAVTWNFRDGKQDQFYADLFTETQIKKEDITFKSVNRISCIPAESAEQCSRHDHDHNFPVTQGFDRSDVLNPKHTVKDARGKLNNMGPDLDTAIALIKKKAFAGSEYDLVDALSLPITMVADAIDSMQKIDDTVDKWDAEKRKNILLAFLSGIFLIVPVVGQVVGSIATLANIGRIIAMVGIAGNVALGIHDVVDNKDNPALAIFGLVLEPLAILDVAKMSKAAQVKRAMSPEDLTKLGGTAGSRLDQIKNANNFCPAKPKKREISMEFETMPMTSLNGIEYHPVVGYPSL
ncbi:hypothetical protein B0I35DRAFT_358159 [Stachybotrys elegans]|uniref:chitinase n=1 Tax=Stachybotrys elegans TaxID=80388 RepID=A0A8K0SLB9_9HYPO|nr:hypothetical protein B0I35DRAFT_358159 [Stachybotrys elegans]